ncbi:unnamed protein product [Darwinula stevensoni]|uniref:Uncharacterized protein n=1 Tax=Darwinula stevensoni TaxID=69355 RepID=A0A7R9ABV9_9CRUS|nr:unnamed protein product [Darwinula stevensoni]CAG0899239.1 unnamed protein product [Darwinula stevensoni]
MLILNPEMLILYPEMLILNPEMLIINPEMLILYPEMLILNPEMLILNPEMLILYPEVTHSIIGFLFTVPLSSYYQARPDNRASRKPPNLRCGFTSPPLKGGEGGIPSFILRFAGQGWTRFRVLSTCLRLAAWSLTLPFGGMTRAIVIHEDGL